MDAILDEYLIDDLVNYELLMIDLKRFIIRDENEYGREPHNDLEKIAHERQVQAILKEYHEKILEENPFVEIQNFAQKIFEENKDIIESGNIDMLCSSLEELISTYGKLKFNYYLIKVFRYFLEATMDHYYEEIIDPKMYNEGHHLEFIEKIQISQNALCQAGGIQLSIQVINNSVQNSKKLEGILLINTILKYGNKEAQDHLLEYLNANQFKVMRPFLYYLQGIIQSFNNNEINKNNINEESKTILVSILIFLKLCCKFCNTEFQNFIRHQENHENK